MNTKKILLIVGLVVMVIGIAVVVAMTGPESSREVIPDLGEDVMYIRESRFMTEVQNIHSNMRRYTGRTVALEGFVQVISDEEGTFHLVRKK